MGTVVFLKLEKQHQTLGPGAYLGPENPIMGGGEIDEIPSDSSLFGYVGCSGFG